MSTNSYELDDLGSLSEVYAEGAKTFAKLFSRWMDGNGWSHPVMTALATACLGGEGWLHSSQISGLRRAQTRNPGPRTFIAIERLNYYVWRYTQSKKLIPGTPSSNNYNKATPILVECKPPPIGWFFSVFCGYESVDSNLTESIQLPIHRTGEYSAALARLLRKLIAEQGFDVFEDLAVVLHRNYPTHETDRVKTIEGLLLRNQELDAETLGFELLSLSRLTAALGGPSTEEELLESLAKATRGRS